MAIALITTLPILPAPIVNDIHATRLQRAASALALIGTTH